MPHTQRTNKPEHENQLAGCSSPYLKQHAEQPVNWYPWGNAAFERARTEQRPIFLSIGYSACHWCHVMAHESFEDEGIAALLNQHFVAVKVDREERPDVDSIYMSAVQMMTGQGGWPLSVFLTPDLQPFFGGTYFPPNQRNGLPGFRTVLQRIAELWQQDQSRLLEGAGRIMKELQRQATGIGSGGALNDAVAAGALRALEQVYDAKQGGFGTAPKFPPSAAVQVLLEEGQRQGNTRLQAMAEHTLKKMGYGGIYDQVGGGFHRYATDEAWMIPHFEKMLYDNAQLPVVYLRAWQLSGNSEFSRVAEETLHYVRRELTNTEGAFYSAQDAESEGIEGIYYAWDYAEVLDMASPFGGEDAAAFFGVRPVGNFDGLNLLHVPQDPEVQATAWGVDVAELWQRLHPLREQLLAVRARRIPPKTDTKILAGWNAMMISAFIYAARLTGGECWRNAAVRAAVFIRDRMWKDDYLWRVHADGRAQIAGCLDDYALTATAFVAIAEETGELSWLVEAQNVVDVMLERFGDETSPGLFYSDGRDVHLPVREKNYWDGVIPSGNAAAVQALQAVARWCGQRVYADRARAIVEEAAARIVQAPRAMMDMVRYGVLPMLHPGAEVILVGRGDDPELQAMWNVMREYRGRAAWLWFDPETEENRTELKQLPYLAERRAPQGEVRGYVCRQFVCQAPVNTAERLEHCLRGVI